MCSVRLYVLTCVTHNYAHPSIAQLEQYVAADYNDGGSSVAMPPVPRLSRLRGTSFIRYVAGRNTYAALRLVYG